MPVDFVSWGMNHEALRSMSLKHDRSGEKREAELAYVEDGEVREFDWVRGEVPRLDEVFANLQFVKVLHPRDFVDVLRHGA